MAEIEKVIRGLELCTKYTKACPDNCPYMEDYDCRIKMERDALELLKETQEGLSKTDEDMA